MTTASIVTYKTDIEELRTVMQCAVNSIIDTVYIVDNSPTNALEDFVRSFSSKIIYIPNHSNPGFGAAHNIILKRIIKDNVDYHIVLNPDIIFEKNVITTLVNYMECNEQVGLIMPKVVYPDGNLQYLCKLLPTPVDWIGRRFIPWKNIMEQRNKRFELRNSGYNRIMNIPYLSGCFMFFRVATLKETGIFDEGIFMYGEDTDITRRIHRRYMTIFYPDVQIIHKHKKESHKNNRLLWIHIKAAVYYFNKWGWFFDKERRAINKNIIKQYLEN
jgi:GT2 family glycosyltransferase